jgi:DNA-binding PadR family transcriptional regulator
MPKTFPIKLEVEEIALGAVLRKLNDMPGIVKLDLDLGHGGEGAGKKELQHAAAKQSGGNIVQEAVKFLMDGPKHIGEIARALGGAKSRAYSAMTQLRKQGLSEAGPGKATHQLTAKARAQLGAVPALPAPTPIVKHGPSGRASPGSGPIILRVALDAGPMSPHDLRAKLTEGGMSPKGVSGVLDRARVAGLIKKNGNGYELTAKGQKIETGASAHG